MTPAEQDACDSFCPYYETGEYADRCEELKREQLCWEADGKYEAEEWEAELDAIQAEREFEARKIRH
jgi:hypothetical protein